VTRARGSTRVQRGIHRTGILLTLHLRRLEARMIGSIWAS
jgi:hypothetical protein